MQAHMRFEAQKVLYQTQTWSTHIWPCFWRVFKPVRHSFLINNGEPFLLGGDLKTACTSLYLWESYPSVHRPFAWGIPSNETTALHFVELFAGSEKKYISLEWVICGYPSWIGEAIITSACDHEGLAARSVDVCILVSLRWIPKAKIDQWHTYFEEMLFFHY